MIDRFIIEECRQFISSPLEQCRAITMQLKLDLGRERKYQEVGHRLAELKPFIEYIYREIERQFEKPSDFYNQCNISRQVYSNMQDKSYDPTLETVYKVLIGLKYHLLDAVILMENAGYTFTFKTRRQLIIIFCITHDIYDTFDVDGLLVEFGEDPMFSNN